MSEIIDITKNSVGNCKFIPIPKCKISSSISQTSWSSLYDDVTDLHYIDSNILTITSMCDRLSSRSKLAIVFRTTGVNLKV